MDNAIEKVAEGSKGLVLEGGGLRGIYTAGILDVFAERGIEFDGVAGVSAGAIHASSYLAHQPGRGIRLYLTYSPTGQFMGFRSWFKTGDFVNYQFAYLDMCDRIIPFDYDALEASKTAFYIVCTNVENGQPYYHRAHSIRGPEMQALRASASLPLLSRMVEYDNLRLLDGGTADSIPVKFLRELGYTKTVVVLTQVAGYRKQPQSMGLFKLLYRQFPGYLEAMCTRHERYNATLELIESLEKSGDIFVFRPSRKVPIHRLERDPRRILEMYELGRSDGLNRLNDMVKWLSYSH